MFYITQDVYRIFHEYFFDTKTEKCWWNKYKLTIHFKFEVWTITNTNTN